MIKNLFLLSLLLAVMAIATFWMNRDLRGPSMVAIEQDAAPDFSLQTLNTGSVSLEDFSGQELLLHFWATWCAPCIIELPKLAAFAENNKGDLSVLAVAVADRPSAITSFLEKNEIAFPENFVIALDPHKQVSKELYGTVKLPETYLLSIDGQIEEKYIGAQEWENKKWPDKINP
jgi:thiol-disulfide isomerase/thioredoxin